MKNIKYTIATLCILLFASCHDLDITSPSVMQGNAVFSSKAGITAYFATVYKDLPIEEFKYDPRADEGFRYTKGNHWTNFTKDGYVCGESVGPAGSVNDVAFGFKYWPYDKIRDINDFIQTLPKYADNFEKYEVDEWLGEAYFCRAFFYYALVKRYGGIPIIKEPQSYPAEKPGDLMVPRNKEVDVWKFIEEDLKNASQMLPKESPRGRANRYVAAALQSRAMLHAACVAKYGQNDTDGEAKEKGFVGIPVTEANYFFRSAYDAACLVDEGNYSLYTKGDDKEQNYVDLFLDNSSSETILAIDYSLTAKGQDYAHSWDGTTLCKGLSSAGVAETFPTLDLVERFVGDINKYIVNNDGTPRRFEKLEDLMNEIDDPRLKASVFFPGTTVRNRYIDIQAGIYKTFKGTAADETAWQIDGSRRPNKTDENGNDSGNLLTSNQIESTYEYTNKQGQKVIKAIRGMCGVASGGGEYATRTGFYMRKYVDYKKTIDEAALNRSAQSWQVIRYAEVLLNRAEAAIELGGTANTEDAKIQINKLRDRAGVSQYDDVSLQNVRNERRMELAFENHIWWDVKRWRIAVDELNNTRFRSLMPYFIAEEEKYIFLKEYEMWERRYTFNKWYYYEPLPGDQLDKNSNLYPNNPNY